MGYEPGTIHENTDVYAVIDTSACHWVETRDLVLDMAHELEIETGAPLD
jgi:hypothetical protein